MRRLAMGTAALAALVATGAAAMADDDVGPGSASQGRRFALQTCAICHLVTPKQLVPRHLAVAPSFGAIANMNSTTASSLHAFLSTPHSIMPNLVLTRQEQRDVITYILSLKR